MNKQLPSFTRDQHRDRLAKCRACR